jgi:hypothetical protein
MRTRLLVIIAIGVAVGSVALRAGAKGFDHSRVTIRGPGLSAPIRLESDDAVAYLSGVGLSVAKWQAPNIGSTLDPDADLGSPYVAVVDIDCGAGRRAEFRQTLYPYSPGGLQVLTPDGATWCSGQNVKAGYWPASDELLQALFAKGLPTAVAGDAQAVSSRNRAAVLASGGSGPGGPIAWLAGLALATIVIGVVLVRRRRASRFSRGL